MSRGKEIDELYHRLAWKWRSVAYKPEKAEDFKCLVRFHNCTPYNVSLYWIDHRGKPIKYPTLRRGSSLNMNTFQSHLWIFRGSDKPDTNPGSPTHDMPNLLAIPEEALDMSHGIPHLNAHFRDPIDRRTAVAEGVMEMNSDVNDAILGMNNTLICSLCKYFVKSYAKEPMKVPCPHFTGEAKFSVSDVVGQSGASRFSPNYFFSCTSQTHRRDHSTKRRNIFLVEPFYSLRERCFLALKDLIGNTDLCKMNLPLSLQEDYIEFMVTIENVNEGI